MSQVILFPFGVSIVLITRYRIFNLNPTIVVIPQGECQVCYQKAKTEKVVGKMLAKKQCACFQHGRQCCQGGSDESN